MPTSDDAFVQNLSRIAADVAPAIAVDTSRVVSTGRRRRDRRRSFAAGAFGVAVLGGVAFTQATAWTSTPVVAAHETAEAPLGRAAFGAPTPEDVAPADETPVPAAMTLGDTTASPADDDRGLPTPAAAALGAVGAGALGAGVFFAVRSRRHTR